VTADWLEPPPPANDREHALALQSEANAQTAGGKCVFCKNKVFWLPGDRAWAKGQIYSESGRREFGITRLCEYCFDETTVTPEDQPDLHAHYKALKEVPEA
jgi:hypothetical protein